MATTHKKNQLINYVTLTVYYFLVLFNFNSFCCLTKKPNDIKLILSCTISSYERYRSFAKSGQNLKCTKKVKYIVYDTSLHKNEVNARNYSEGKYLFFKRKQQTQDSDQVMFARTATAVAGWATLAQL